MAGSCGPAIVCWSGMSHFSFRLIAWQQHSGRHDLPWQGSRDPYRIWVSEIMLQQTQVSTVIPYYQRFMERFPDLPALAAADLEEVLRCWSGLGYYSRARHLHAAACHVVHELGGVFPREAMLTVQLPGVGRSTAAAIAVFSAGAREAILDGNVKRVLARHQGVHGWPGDAQVEARLWELARSLLPGQDIEAYTQGLMDLGATVCTRRAPRCAFCPLQADCVARLGGLADQLPTPRPRIPVQQQQLRLMIYSHAGRVWLERRPAPGIWGGLWCFARGDSDEPGAQCERTWGVPAIRVNCGEVFSHTLTHRRLHIEPVMVELRDAPRHTSVGRWLAPVEALTMAIPVPVRRLLQPLAAAADSNRTTSGTQYNGVPVPPADQVGL